jgi:hypothetical protein
VTLLPSLDVTLCRVTPRDSTRQMQQDDHRRLHEQFVAAGAFAGIVIDNSTLTADQTADRVMDACGAGEALVLAAVV